MPAIIFKMKLLIQKIKEKKSLQNLDDSLMKEYVEKYLTEKTDINNEKSASFKKIVKEVRNELNRIYGCFILSNKLELASHSSTKERIKIYPELYKKIFAITGKPNSILDISAGLNPLSYNYLNCTPRYIATELTLIDVNNLNFWFKKNRINAKALQLNLYKSQNFPEADITFLFKTLDLLNDFKLAEKIITSIKSKYLVISFSTKTLKNKSMNHPKRGWIEQMLKRLNKEYTKLIYPNEIFYIIKTN